MPTDAVPHTSPGTETSGVLRGDELLLTVAQVARIMNRGQTSVRRMAQPGGKLYDCVADLGDTRLTFVRTRVEEAAQRLRASA